MDIYVRQAITTTYKGPTSSRGSRVIARAQAGRVVVPWDHALNPAANHAAAAMVLARKFGWLGMWHGGATVDGYAFVLPTDAVNGPNVATNGSSVVAS